MRNLSLVCLVDVPVLAMPGVVAVSCSSLSSGNGGSG
jgi:hypothetical protein